MKSTGSRRVPVTRVELGSAARLRIGQDGSDHRFHVAAYTLTVVVEYGGNAAHVLRCRVAGHELLNELLSDEGPDVRMHENIVNRKRELALRRQSGRCDRAIQEGSGRVVRVRIEGHP